MVNPVLAENRKAFLTENNNTDAFEAKIKKLKIVYDNGILSDEEFSEEKKKLLSQL